MSCLQEISRNIDAMALAEPYQLPDLRELQQRAWNSFAPQQVFDTQLNEGNKTLDSNGGKRMLAFAEWVFTRPESTIIVGGGHSLWFREFFRAYLPPGVDHVSKVKKIRNCGVVALTLERGTHVNNGRDVVFRIDPESC